MTRVPIHLAVEDELSEVIAHRLLKSARRYDYRAAMGRTGFGYLKSRIHEFNRAAKGCPFLVLTDLDRDECPPALLANWLGRAPREHNLLLCVAVREVEAWLLADSPALCRFFGLRRDPTPRDVEEIPDPKRYLIGIAARARKRDVRNDIVPRPGSTARQGRNYNARMAEFVLEYWEPKRAMQRARSLTRMIQLLDSFVVCWPEQQSPK